MNYIIPSFLREEMSEISTLIIIRKSGILQKHSLKKAIFNSNGKLKPQNPKNHPQKRLKSSFFSIDKASKEKTTPSKGRRTPSKSRRTPSKGHRKASKSHRKLSGNHRNNILSHRSPSSTLLKTSLSLLRSSLLLWDLKINFFQYKQRLIHSYFQYLRKLLYLGIDYFP